MALTRPLLESCLRIMRVWWTLSPRPTEVRSLWAFSSPSGPIDETTGIVTLSSGENWNGMEDITFVASDGELQATMTVTVWVLAVNDMPWFAAVNGEPIEFPPLQDDKYVRTPSDEQNFVPRRFV